MTVEGDSSPEGDTGGAGRRRARVDQVGAELAALRRDVAEHGGLLSEALPRLDDLTRGVAELRAAVRGLVQEAAEQDAVDKAELEARRAAGLADEPPAPWCWPALDRPNAELAWRSLGAWVAAVLCREQQLPLRRLPSCWPWHPPVVSELSALRAANVAALRCGAHPAAALAWQRDLPGALDRIGVVVDPERCPPGLHLIADSTQLPSQRERDRVGALPCLPDAWSGSLQRVAAADVATRRGAQGD